MMKGSLKSERLVLTQLSPDDIDFVFELVNSPGWLKFIGDRNVKTREDAGTFILKIMNNPNVNYWVVRLEEQLISIGIVSFIKRDYLEHHDLGFAFLSKHSKQGYAFEAATIFLKHLSKENLHQCILATTLKDNLDSISLLKKLGFRFDKSILADGEELQVFAINMDQFLINQITRSFFDLFTNKNNRAVNLNAVYQICLPETIIIKKTKTTHEVYDLNAFIEPRQKILTDGTLMSFEEIEIGEETKIAGEIAQRFSHYIKSGYSGGKNFQQKGSKLFQFVKTGEGWKISAVTWQDDEE